MKSSLHVPIIFCLVMLLYAMWSVGFLHPDEHYQVIEYMNVFLGRFESSILSPLEWKEMMRPWFQAIIYSGPISALRALVGLYPFFEVTLMRFFSAALALCWLVPLINEVLARNHTKYQGIRKQLALIFFVVPVFIFVLSVRTSSDSVAAHLFLIGLTRLGLPFQLHTHQVRRLIEFSLLGGLAILVRYQMVMWVGLCFLWFLFGRKWHWRDVIVWGVVSLVIASLELPFNYWGRGQWYSSSLNHIDQNIFHGVAATFGTLPWWGYFKIFLLQGAPPFSLLYLYLSMRHCVRERRSLLTLLMVVSFAFFSAISHKEGRFLTPTIFLLPFVLALVVPILKTRLVLIVGGLQLLITLIMSAHPTYRPIIAYESIAQHLGAGETIAVMKDRAGKELKFELHHYQKTPWQTVTYTPQSTGLVVSSTYVQYQELKTRGCQLLRLSYPEFLLANNSFKWRDRSNIWGVWKCQDLAKSLEH